MTRQHTTPCNQCPWRRKAARGYLGDSTPEEFLACSDADAFMPCHIHVDYEDPDWQDTVGEKPQCAGRAIHFANRFKLSKNPVLLVLPKDVENVFQWPQEFLDHHTRTGTLRGTRTGRMSAAEPQESNPPKTGD